MGSLSENAMMPARRFPRGKRGLKLTVGGWQRCAGGSLPSREAWIEIPATLFGGTWVASLPSREAWIEIVHLFVIKSVGYPSLPSREAWIEIPVPELSVLPPHGRFPRGKRGLKWRILSH